MAEHEPMLRKQLDKIAEEYNYKDATFKIESVSSGGANYSSVLYNITISTPDNKELQLFAKVINFDEKTRASFGNTVEVFDVENYVYKDLAKIFRKLELKFGVPENERYVFPKFFGFHPKEYEETLILENLAAKGYEVFDRLKSVDWPYASKAIEIIAKFHALSMAYGEQNPEEYNKRLTDSYAQIEPIYKIMGESFSKFAETALSVVKEENKDRLQKFIDRECSIGNVLIRYSKPLRKPVLIHSDFRQSNIMHKINKDGTIDLIPVDYQTVKTGCCIYDLLYFIVTSTDGQFRGRYYQLLVDQYYDSLRKALQHLKLDPDKVYSRKDFDYELREALPHGLIMGIFVLPVVTVEPEDAPDLNSEDFLEKMAKPKISRYYTGRMNDVIDDYVKWGIL